MTLSELVDIVSKQEGIIKSDTKSLITKTFDIIEEKLLNGEKVSIVGFGSFHVEEKEERKGFNPRQQKSIVIPKRKVLKFRPAKKLKERIRD